MYTLRGRRAGSCTPPGTGGQAHGWRCGPRPFLARAYFRLRPHPGPGHPPRVLLLRHGMTEGCGSDGSDAARWLSIAVAVRVASGTKGQLTMRSTLALLLAAVASGQDGATTSTRRRPAHSPQPTAHSSASIAAHMTAGYHHRRAARSERRLRELHVQLRPHLHVVGLEGRAVHHQGGGRWRRPCRGGPGCAFVSCCPPLPLPLPVPLCSRSRSCSRCGCRARACDGVRAWFHRATTRCRSPATSP
eukprot:COSAG04_NODE_759_length_10538_cov_6.234218_2_plen_246_part_00